MKLGDQQIMREDARVGSLKTEQLFVIQVSLGTVVMTKANVELDLDALLIKNGHMPQTVNGLETKHSHANQIMNANWITTVGTKLQQKLKQDKKNV